MPKWHPFSVASVFASVQQLNWLLGAHHCFIWKWQLGSLNTPGEITDPQVKWPLKPTGHPTSVRLNCYRVLWSNDCRDSTSQIQSALSQLVCQQWCHIMSYRIPRWQTPRGASKNIIYIYIYSICSWSLTSVPFGIHLYMLVHFHQTSGGAVRPSLSVSVSAVINTLTSCASGQKQYQSILKLYSALCPVLDTNILTKILQIQWPHVATQHLKKSIILTYFDIQQTCQSSSIRAACSSDSNRAASLVPAGSLRSSNVRSRCAHAMTSSCCKGKETTELEELGGRTGMLMIPNKNGRSKTEYVTWSLVLHAGTRSQRIPLIYISSWSCLRNGCHSVTTGGALVLPTDLSQSWIPEQPPALLRFPHNLHFISSDLSCSTLYWN